jgi:hypothetical protein
MVIYFRSEIGIFDTKTFVYHEMKVKVRDPAILNHGKRLICDDDGNLILLFVDAGFVTWNENKQEFPLITILFRADDWMIVDIIQEPRTKKYWIGTYTGTASINVKPKQLNYRGHNPEKKSVHRKIGSVPLARGF